jgi:hypothetical protein
MKPNYRRVLARFAPDTRFEVRPTPSAPFRVVEENDFERLKNRLLAARLNESPHPKHYSRLRRAANEAAALAWATAYPLLVFPALFEEKVSTALRYEKHQAWVRDRSRELLAV